MQNPTNENKNSLGIKTVLHYLFFHHVFFQLVGILRATAIYNTSYLANLSNVIISLLVIVLFLLDFKNMKLKLVEVFLLIFPGMHSLYGLLINGLNRNTFSHLFTSTFFAVLLIYARNQRFVFTRKLQLKFANWMFWGLLISIISYKLAPLIGVKVYSVGIISIFMLFPMITFFNYKNKFKFILTIILLVLGGKRGVLLSGLLAFVSVGLGQKSIKNSTRITVLVTASALSFSMFYMSMSPSRIMQLPDGIQPMFVRMMRTNPFSQYSSIDSDPRILEVKGAMAPLIENPLYILIGRGGGYSYEYLDATGNFVKELHNTHFSPVAILSRYGIIYTFILYFFILKTIYINYRKMIKNKLSLEKQVLLIYVIASFINSFTAFTIYLDYLFILSLGLLNSNILPTRVENLKKISNKELRTFIQED